MRRRDVKTTTMRMAAAVMVLGVIRGVTGTTRVAAVATPETAMMGVARGAVGLDAEAARDAKARLANDGYDVAEGATVRFTHDVAYEEARRARVEEAEEGSEDSTAWNAVGNPGMIYATARRGAREQLETFRLGARDALVVPMTLPPVEQRWRYFSFVTYVVTRDFRRISAMAGWPVNSANIVETNSSSVAFVVTRSRETFADIKRAFGEQVGVNLQPLFDHVRLGRNLPADLLSASLRCAYWPNDRPGDVLGEWSKIAWTEAFFVRAPMLRRGSTRGSTENDIVPQSLPKPNGIENDRYDEFGSFRERLETLSVEPSVAPPAVAGFDRASAQTTLIPISVDHARCVRDPLYYPWSRNGINSRSTCFGATSDCAYSMSGRIDRGRSGAFLVVCRGPNLVTQNQSTFSNIALYATGNPISTILSPRDVQVVAAIDDRTFQQDADAFAVAFGASAAECARVSVPCVIATDMRARASMFVLERDYLHPHTATAPDFNRLRGVPRTVCDVYVS